MIPLSTTTISVLRIKAEDEYDDPYDGSGEPERDVMVTGVRAVIDQPGGNLQLEGGQQNVIDYGLKCDPLDFGLKLSDWIKDDLTSRTFRIVWFIYYPNDHIEALMRDTEGEV